MSWDHIINGYFEYKNITYIEALLHCSIVMVLPYISWWLVTKLALLGPEVTTQPRAFTTVPIQWLVRWNKLFEIS